MSDIFPRRAASNNAAHHLTTAFFPRVRTALWGAVPAHQFEGELHDACAFRMVRLFSGFRPGLRDTDSPAPSSGVGCRCGAGYRVVEFGTGCRGRDATSAASSTT